MYKKISIADLLKDSVYKAQEENILRFAPLRTKLNEAFGYGFVIAIIAIIIGQYSDALGMAATFVVFAVCVVGVWAALQYKCPNCGTTPKSFGVGVDGAGLSVRSGLDPFARRCNCCGYYLSKAELERDFQRAKFESDNVPNESNG
jgi:hypothetical protein